MRSIISWSSKAGFIISVRIIAFVAVFPMVASAQQWQSIAPMHVGRFSGCAVTLLDGRVLVAGGADGSVALSSCEIYDPNTNTWTMTGSMNEPRDNFPMILLPDGRVFVAGGITGVVTSGVVSTTAGCEIYDPNTGLWQEVAQMAEPSENFPAILLPNGKIFLNGGLDANIPRYLSQSEFFDPETNSIQELAPMPIPYFGQIAFYDSIHNQLLIQGGSNGGLNGLYWNTTQVYDIQSNSWSYSIHSLAEHDITGYTVMSDNSLVCLGGRISSFVAHDSIEVLRPPYTSWSFLGHLTSPRWHGVIVRANNDSVLYIGGNNDPGVNTNVFDSTNWFNYQTGQVTQGPRMIQARSVFVAAVTRKSFGCDDSTIVLVFGGLSKNGEALNSCEKLLIGNSDSPSHNALLHRSSAQSFFGQVDTLQLLLDVNSQINIDSLWPSLTEVQATYAWDSSVVSFAGYTPPAGWVLNSLANHRNSLDFDIQNNGSAATQPVDLGTALFLPHTTDLATSWVSLPVLTLTAGGDVLSLCTSQNEDSHWSVKALGEPSSVTPSPNGGKEFSVWPNPAGSELFVRNPAALPAEITLFDAIGREITHESIPANTTTLIDVHSFVPGVYFAKIVCGGTVSSQAVVKQ